MKRIIIYFVAALIATAAIAKEVDLGDGLTLSVSDSLVETEISSCLYAGSDQTCLLVIKKLEKQDFDTDKVKENLDRLLFNLKDYVETESETDGLFEFGRDYKIKWYEDGKGHKLATYTSYVYEFPYCILIDYTDEIAIQTLRTVAMSEKYNSTWWHNVWTFGSRDTWVLCLVFLLFIIVCMPVRKTWFGLLFGIGVAAFVCTPLWGVWGAWAFYIALGAFFGACVSEGNLETILNGAIEGLG